MSGPVFVDTSVLVYARDRTEQEKQQAAARWMGELWATRRGRLSFQVLQEYYVTATRKLEPPRARELVKADVLALHAWKPVQVDLALLERAWGLEERYGFSWSDAQVVAAALAARCTYLLTEDLQDGQRVDGLTIVSPFLRSPGSIIGDHGEGLDDEGA